jgi:cell division protein FtsI/penicillin-binding protein 2
VAERELHAGIIENRAESGSAVIMDPRTGEILALASEPTFDPNKISAANPEQQLNRAVQVLYEPGSTFKVVTASAAFEEGVESPTDLVDVSAGQIHLGARVVSDSHRIDAVISFTDVLVKSSNVGAIKVGLKLGGERLGRYVHLFGFGARACKDFPSENAGQVSGAAHWSDSVVASVSMGYQVGVTPLQMARAVSAIANGGELVQPHVVRAVIEEGRRSEVEHHVVRRTVSQSTTSTLTSIMEQVVERGTGTTAQIPGYSIAAKTGTAQRLIAGHYSHTEFNASFVGFLPSRDPAVTILVLINSPHGHGYYGGVVAGPVFKRIAEAAVRYLGIPPTAGGAAPVLFAAPRPTAPGPPPGGSRPAVTIVAASHAAETPGVVPDVVGLSARDAARSLVRLGLNPVLNGTGIVIGQNPPAGTALDLGAACHLTLARLPSVGGDRQ